MRTTALFQRHPLAVALCAALAMTALEAPLFAQDVAQADTSAATKDARQLQQVIVTGTRQSNRTEAESLSPIDVLTPADLTATGATDLASALNTLLPSLDFPRPAINDGNDAIRPATLRGLSPDDVLVLVDGKRYHTTALVNYNSSVGRGSAPADLNSIPISAIDHLEVLRDGAAAQYGSDAIAGVINIVLKHGGKEGDNSITASGGIMDKGDGAQNGLQGSVGIPLGGTGKDGDKAPGWVRFAWNYGDTMTTNRAENKDFSTTLAGASNPSGIPYERYGDPAVKTKQGLLNFGYDITPNVELYGYLNLSRRDVNSNGYFRAYDSARNVEEVYPNGFLPHIVNASNDTAAVLGIKGTTEGGWSWDASGNYGSSNVVFDIANSINTNLYRTTGSSPTYFYAGAFRNAQAVANVDISKAFTPTWLPNPVTLSFGGEYRKEKYTIKPGEPDSYFFDPDTLIPGTTGPYAGGSQVFPGLTPSVAGTFTRHSEAAYIDAETDLTSKLSAGVAARYEDYSDSGSTRSGKVSLRYQFTDTFALRGTASNGFRAPSLAQQNYESVVTLIQNGALAQIGTFRTSDPAAIALGAKPLSPEKSTNYGLGGVWQPVDNFSATLDVYQIRIWNQILYSDQIAVDPTPTSQVTGAQFFVNGGTSRTRGADLITNYSMDLNEWGKLRFTASGNYNKTKVLEITTPAFGRSSEGLLTKATPRTKLVFGSDWLIGGFDVHAGLTRYGSVTRLGDLADGSQDQKFSARWLLDLATSYTVDAWTFTLGGDNITNAYPTKSALNNVYEDRADGLQYSSLSPFGFNGRYWYGKATFRF
jgi:iron complex outermembrane receptor protein